jgi:uncharacterized protein YprB with RNaseH-like and TPR domain
MSRRVTGIWLAVCGIRQMEKLFGLERMREIYVPSFRQRTAESMFRKYTDCGVIKWLIELESRLGWR